MEDTVQQNLGIMFFSSAPKQLVSVNTFRGGMRFGAKLRVYIPEQNMLQTI